MLLPSLTACLLLLSSGTSALRHGEQDNGVVQSQWEAPHVAAHHQRRDGFIIADGKRISRRTHAKLHGRQPPPPPPGPPAPPPPGKAPGGSWKDKPTAPSHVKIKVGELWRGETFRKPEDVRKAGGFESHAKRIFEGTHPDYPKGMTQDAFKLGSSVYHHSKKTCSCSSYVSMSASKDEATNFASKQTAERTYVYKIRPETSKVVDVAGSLGGDRHLTWTKEKEIAGVYEVPWKQVIGWHEGTPTKAQGGGSEIVFSEFINKADVYPDDPLPEEVSLSGEFEIRSELAGFPEGHLGRTELPWKEFNDVPVEEWLNEYMLERNFDKDKAKFTEARKAADWAKLPCSSLKRKRAGAPAGCDRVKNQAAEDDKTAKPGNAEDEEVGLGGEKPDSGSGSEPGEVPEITDKWASTAEEISKREFTDLATSRGLTKVANKFSQTLSELRGKWLGYKALTKTSPKFKTIYGIAGKVAKPLEKIGTPLWVLGVIDAFAREASALEKAAAMTALIPFVGWQDQPVAYIQPKEVAMPTRFGVAYIVGQSKALEDIDPKALSAREFIMDNTKDLTEERVNYFALHHTLQVAKLFRGALGGDEAKLDTLWPTGDTAPTRPLQLLIAMRYGRIFEETKMTWIGKNRQGNMGLFPELNDPGEIHRASHPNIPPIKDPKANNEKLSYLGVVLGLGEEIVRNTPRGVKKFSFADLVQNADMILALLRLDVHATAKQSGKAGDEKAKMMRL
ncbi:hypothetical protein MY4824_000363 [Beauveria thailandica]